MREYWRPDFDRGSFSRVGDDSYPVDPALDAVFVLIAELMRERLLNRHNVENMARRLQDADLPDLATRLTLLHLSNEMDTPEQARASFHVIDGGNDED